MGSPPGQRARMVVMARQKSDGAFCPRFHTAVELIGRRWTGAILRAMRSGERRFTDIAAVIPGLHDRLLAERLRELETAGVIRREVPPTGAGRVEYHLTDMGRDLDQVMDAIAVWAERWVPAPARGGGEEMVTPVSECGREEVVVASAQPTRDE